MTPMAQMVVRKSIADGHQYIPQLLSSDCHCFEVTEVRPLMVDLAKNAEWRVSNDQHIFLPSPITWIEWKTNNGRNAGKLESDGPKLTLSFYYDNGKVFGAREDINIFRHPDDGRLQIGISKDLDDDDRIECLSFSRLFLAALALINTPRIISQRQHMPHAGLQRQIAASKKMVGRFPLRAWTEIVLEVHRPKTHEADHDTHLSGGKALHFCRAHLRIKRGRVEFVSHHWRGDPSIGIKRSRYKVVA